ncbi:MAG: GerMN domain-containing protein [Acidobacteriota bacterium]
MASRRQFVIVTVLVAVAIAVGWWAIVDYLARPAATQPASAAAPAAQPVGNTERRIKAALFYVAEDGSHLTSVERDVAFADGAGEQAKRLIEAQLVPPPPPLLSAIPGGTSLRGLYVTDGGEAYVDLGGSIRSAHPGGSLNEIYTVYTIVSVLTVNLPAITSVQILIDGHEVDTLAGHVDLRRPLPRAAQWLERPRPASLSESAPPPETPAAVRR